jgi:F-type H+-transporting ATPase subunit a
MSIVAAVMSLALLVSAPVSEGEDVSAGKMFTQLFKHIEPHAVFGVWWGGNEGFGIVSAHETDAAGKPLLDEHDHPISFHSRSEFVEHYQAEFGGGDGILVYNINTVQWIAGGVLILLFGWAGMKARRRGHGSPSGALFHVVESMVLFVRDDMVYQTLGKQSGRPLLPLFLTQFFFILAMNIFGLIPDFTGGLAGTATANLAVTGALALTTLLCIHFMGIKQHGPIKHFVNFVPKGLPWFVLPIIIPVEIVGMLVKPLALMVRLFANLLAGHLVILSFFGLSFLFASWFVATPLLLLAIGIGCLELFVSFVQAYVFTYLSIIFVGASLHPDH